MHINPTTLNDMLGKFRPFVMVGPPSNGLSWICVEQHIRRHSHWCVPQACIFWCVQGNAIGRMHHRWHGVLSKQRLSVQIQTRLNLTSLLRCSEYGSANLEGATLAKEVMSTVLSQLDLVTCGTTMKVACEMSLFQIELSVTHKWRDF